MGNTNDCLTQTRVLPERQSRDPQGHLGRLFRGIVMMSEFEGQLGHDEHR